jgi:hypothetical protein
MPTEPEPASTGMAKSPTADEAEREDRTGEVTGEGLEGVGGLGCALDVGHVVGMEGLGGGHDDGEHDQVGERHAAEHVEPAGGLFAPGSFGTLSLEGLCPGTALGFVTHLFEAVGTLPKEQVRRNGRAQHGDQECQVGLVELDMGNEGVAEDTAPLMGDQDGHHEIGQKAAQSTLNTSAIRAKEPSTSSVEMRAPAKSAQSQVGPAWSSCIPEPTATRSAAMLRALATMRATRSTARIDRPVAVKRLTANSPRPLPVARAVRSQISCTAAIKGSVSRAAHKNDRPYFAPAWE